MALIALKVYAEFFYRHIKSCLLLAYYTFTPVPTQSSIPANIPGPSTSNSNMATATPPNILNLPVLPLAVQSKVEAADTAAWVQAISGALPRARRPSSRAISPCTRDDDYFGDGAVDTQWQSPSWVVTHTLSDLPEDERDSLTEKDCCCPWLVTQLLLTVILFFLDVPGRMLALCKNVWRSVRRCWIKTVWLKIVVVSTLIAIVVAIILFVSHEKRLFCKRSIKDSQFLRMPHIADNVAASGRGPVTAKVYGKMTA